MNDLGENWIDVYHEGVGSRYRVQYKARAEAMHSPLRTLRVPTNCRTEAPEKAWEKNPN